MFRKFAVAALCAMLASTATAQATIETSEAELRQRIEQAAWPADIVRLTDEYRVRFPRSGWVGNAEALRARAADTMRVLEDKDVRLYRGAFTPVQPDARTSDDTRRAALGDKDAAVRLAHANQQGRDGVAPNLNRYVGWLQYASRLGHDIASYELAVYFRREAQPVLASRYEARAVELGYTLPRELDHFRK